MIVISRDYIHHKKGIWEVSGDRDNELLLPTPSHHELTRKEANIMNHRQSFYALGVGTGVSVGVAIGLALDNLALGIGIGLSIGCLSGSFLERNSSKSTEKNQMNS
jgi:hypothetical protein